MSDLVRDDLVELGVSVPTKVLTQWASAQVAAAKGSESRLEMRGFSAAHLAEIRDLIGAVEKRRPELGDDDALLPAVVATAERLRVEVLGYWREAKRLAQVAFGTQPDLLAKFRTGVQTGLLIMNLVREVESMMALMREHGPSLAPLGADADFVARGDVLLGRLKEAKVRLDAACREFPAPALQQCYEKGLLYDRTRRLVRIGRLEFLLDPEVASKFNFTRVRRERPARSTRRPKKSKTRER